MDLEREVGEGGPEGLPGGGESGESGSVLLKGATEVVSRGGRVELILAIVELAFNDQERPSPIVPHLRLDLPPTAHHPLLLHSSTPPRRRRVSLPPCTHFHAVAVVPNTLLHRYYYLIDTWFTR